VSKKVCSEGADARLMRTIDAALTLTRESVKKEKKNKREICGRQCDEFNEMQTQEDETRQHAWEESGVFGHNGRL
jgi:hypothetical protein